MAELTRFGVSMDAELLSAFDDLIARKGYANRSEAFRDLVRETLIKQRWSDRNEPTVAALCIVFDPHMRDLSAKLTSAQHDHGDCIVSSMHVHLDHDHCLEVIVLKGPAGELQDFADAMLAIRGVKHGQLVMTTTGEGLD